MDKHGLGQIAARLAQRIMVGEKGLELLPLSRLQPEARDERAPGDARKLLRVAGAKDLDEQRVARLRGPDVHLLGRRVRDVDDAADAFARDEVGRIQPQVDGDLRRSGCESRRSRRQEGEQDCQAHAEADSRHLDSFFCCNAGKAVPDAEHGTAESEADGKSIAGSKFVLRHDGIAVKACVCIELTA